MTKFAICTSAIMHLVCPQKHKHCLRFLENCNTLEKSHTKVMEIFRGQTRCLMLDVQKMANSKT